MPLDLPFVAGQTGDDKVEAQRYEILRKIGQQALKSGDTAVTYPVTKSVPSATPVPITFGLATPLKWPIADFGGQVFNVKAYGAKGDGYTDDILPIQKTIAAAAAAGGGVVFLPPGTYKVVQVGAVVPFVITASNTYIVGAGRTATNINFVPATGGAVFQFNNSGTEINYNGIKDLSFTTADTTIQKTMVLVYDCNNFIVERISNTAGVSWTGASSEGVRFRGRQELRMRDCEIAADLPVVIDENPNLAGAAEISFDHSSIENCDLAVTSPLTNACITIKDNTVLTNCSFENLALVLGGGGISANSTAPATSWNTIFIRNCRTEQTTSATAYSIQLLHSGAQVQSLVIDGFQCDGGMNGIKLSNAKYASLRSISYGGSGTFLNLAATVDSFLIQTSFYGGGATITDSSTNPSCFYLVKGSNAPFTSIGSLVGTLNGVALSRSLALKSAGNLTLANGRNDNVVVGDTSFVQSINGPTLAFQISGIVPTGGNGQILTLVNNTSQVFTLNNNDANSSAANRIFTPGGAGVTTSNTGGTVTLIYDAGFPGWVLISRQ